jgi:phage shock protein E
VTGAVAKDLVARGALLLDVRNTSEYASGALPGAMNIPVTVIDSLLSELDISRPIVVYCASGTRAGQALTNLCGKGYRVYSLGAMSNWPQ